MTEKILIVDDEEGIRFTFTNFLMDAGYHAEAAASHDEALGLLAGGAYDLMFVDIIMDGKNGIELLRAVKEKQPNAQVIIITGAPSVETASEALRLGALDYLVKPIRESDLIKSARLALEHKRLADEKDRCRSNVDAIFKSVKDGIVTVDEKMGIAAANLAARKLCGFKPDDAPGAFIRAVSNGCSGACVQLLKETLSARKSANSVHIECRRDDRGDQVISVSAAPLIDNGGRFSGCVMVMRDETRLFDLERSVSEHRAFDRMIGTSMPIKQVKSMIKALADVQTTVLITGESGTGKELAVEALYRAGGRSAKPLVKVNCAALAETLLESELFGHVHGAFTGAVRDKAGRFELADGGTLFLDEIGDISPKMQSRLLRVLETMTFERVGDATPIQVDVRVVAATNHDLARQVDQGRFREDLYYRLKVVELNLPALRDRKEDIPLLTNHFLAKFNSKFGKRIKAVSSDVERLFLRHPWPGNVREMENAMEHAFILCNEGVITVAHLPRDLGEFYGQSFHYRAQGRRHESEAIELALEKAGGNKAKAARLLCMSRKTIYRKIDKYNIAC